MPQHAFAWQLYELATILLEDSAKICYSYDFTDDLQVDFNFHHVYSASLDTQRM